VIREFDVCGPLPTGVTVLEASAGTGKTHTIAALAARYVAEGTPLDRLLLVTFTRMATGELRERVRARVTADAASERDPVRRERLARAVADFDAATIATTHGFCQEVLSGLGVAGDVERDAEFVEDVSELVSQVVDDLYVRRFHRADGAPAFTRRQAQEIAEIAVDNPLAPIEPAAATENTTPAMRARLAHAVRDELDRRKQLAGLMTYDDLLTRLNATLEGPGGDAVAETLRSRFEVVLVDEFQDTDPVQWNIMRRAFGGGTLVLIGDPKQAIYAFRGADVYAYLDAAREATTQATLDVNWRSDQGLIDAYDALFGGARLGHEGIVYRTVRATAANQEPRLTGAPHGAPLRIRVVRRDEPSIATTPSGYARNASAREHIAKDLALDVVELLDSPARVDGEPVAPGHVAVLVQTNRSAALVRDALEDAGVPAVINGAGSVFGTRQAVEWLRLLEAIERPADERRAHAAALTSFLGWSPARIAGATDADWADVHARLHEWARVLRTGGVASLTETITLAEELTERVLKAADGARRLTDLRHVGELLHAAATTEQRGAVALVTWLRGRIAEAERDTADEDRSRRLETDAPAVQVLTVHRSKGLEFPIVYYPYLWEPGYIPPGQPVAYHDADAGDRRTIDVGLEGPDFDRHKAQHAAEERGEDLRLAYVALTRAKHQAIIWWAPSFNSRDSALGRLLFARAADGTIPAAGSRTPGDDEAVQRFETLAAEAPGRIAVEPSRLGRPAVWGPRPAAPAELTASHFGRPLDHRWRRTSFSDITSGVHEARVGSEPEEGLVADEPEAPVRPAAPAGDEALRAVPSLLGDMPAGTAVGTFVHRVLEATDFGAADLDAELSARVEEVQARRAVELGDVRAVVAGLRAAIETPLGPDGRRLRDLARADRLDELDFEFPLVGGDSPTGRLALDAIAAVLRAHLPADDPLAGYADRLADPALRSTIRGYVTGSIDLVARTDARFTVVDYKTNRLAAPGEPLTAWHHRPAALAAEMERGHYGLQALLYTVALHRYLRWRLAGYDPERHLGGVLYLFVRGMTGPDTPVADGGRCGVFAWQPPAGLVPTLSDALDRAP
jgi:exodeoxyribonuclease V beta subunit